MASPASDMRSIQSRIFRALEGASADSLGCPVDDNGTTTITVAVLPVRLIDFRRIQGVVASILLEG